MKLQDMKPGALVRQAYKGGWRWFPEGPRRGTRGSHFDSAEGDVCMLVSPPGRTDAYPGDLVVSALWDGRVWKSFASGDNWEMGWERA